MPSEYLNLPLLDKAFVIGSIEVKIEADKKAQQEAKKTSKGKPRKRR